MYTIYNNDILIEEWHFYFKEEADGRLDSVDRAMYVFSEDAEVEDTRR